MKNTTNILFEKFEILETLKKDQHAGVYLADHIYLGKKIILKSLNIKSIGDDSVIERFKREAKILARLDHPNVIKVLDFGTHEDHFYISFEYFESRNLRDVINSNNLSEDEKRSVIIQILKGLDYAHAHQIIHRDIKPENILLSDDLQIKIGDFGLALSSSDKFVTSQYSVVGTPSYMSPEQIIGEKLDERTDLFSAGIVILELLSGENLFLGKDAAESMNNIVNLEDDKIKEAVVKFDDDLNSLITGLLKKNVNSRIKSANECLKILDVPQESTNIHNDAGKKKSKRGLYLIPLVTAVILIAVYFFSLNQNNADEAASGFEPEEIPQTKINDSVSVLNLEADKPIEKVVDNAGESQQNTSSKNKDEVNNDIPAEIVDKPELDNIVSTGELFVDVFPYAYVYVDSQLMETTPIKKNIELESGLHKLELVHPDYPKYSSNIDIKTNEILSVKVNLDTLFGYLSVDVFPWGKIYLNGKYFAETPVPVTRPIKLFPGEYQLSIRNPEFANIEQKISVVSNDTLKMQFRF